METQSSLVVVAMYGWSKTNKCITSSPYKNVDVGEKIGDLLDIQSGGAQSRVV